MRRKVACGYAVFIVLLLALTIASIRLGSRSLSFSEFAGGVLQKDGFEKASLIIYQLRMPRALAAILAGTGMAVSGLLLQNITGNALAGPNIIGVNAGAGFAVISLLYFFPGVYQAAPYAAFAGALVTTIIIVLLSLRARHSKSTVVLAGVAITSLLNAGISMISLIDADVLALYNDFSVGGISGVQMESLSAPAVIIALGALAAFAIGKSADVLTLGDELALSLGVRVRFVRTISILIASACAGAVVSFAGLLGFVGLVVPNMAKRMFGAATRRAVCFSALIGSSLMLLADITGRTLFTGTEIPAGLVMAVIGVPFFIWLLIGRRKRADF